MQYESPAILTAYDDPNCLDDEKDSKPSVKVCCTVPYLSRKDMNGARKQYIEPVSGLVSLPIDNYDPNDRSFNLFNDNEQLSCDEQTFIARLKCKEDSKVKVVAIIGNTGDGKSHTMNHVFFNGETVFKTSSDQDSCTVGVWAAYQPDMNAICLDTEGLLGSTSSDEHQRKRMLMKILAVCDILIYRTKSERLHTDMYEFLADSSRAFTEYFSKALESLNTPGSRDSHGPELIIFHETVHTKVLTGGLDGKSPEEVIRERLFSTYGTQQGAYRSLTYRGSCTGKGKTDFSRLRETIQTQLDDVTVRSPRKPSIVFNALVHLNKTFSGGIKGNTYRFPAAYFTCTIECIICKSHCQLPMDHLSKNEPHKTEATNCRFVHTYENRVKLCKRCLDNGRETIVEEQTMQNNDGALIGLAKYALSGSVIECSECGEIFRSRQYWYGNKGPEDVVQTRNIHVWEDRDLRDKEPSYTGQHLIDKLNYISGSVTSAGARPAKQLKHLITETFRPQYWKPDSQITNCYCCNLDFEREGIRFHHCRNCGEGVCHPCSKTMQPVPHRGWKDEVRVCDICVEAIKKNQIDESTPEEDIKIRQYVELVNNTIASVSTLLEKPKGYVKDIARPSYWVPDEESPECQLCSMTFDTKFEEPVKTKRTQITEGPIDRYRHHCRACGKAVCGACSTSRRTIPERGFKDSRVCDSCIMEGKFKTD